MSISLFYQKDLTKSDIFRVSSRVWGMCWTLTSWCLGSETIRCLAQDSKTLKTSSLGRFVIKQLSHQQMGCFTLLAFHTSSPELQFQRIHPETRNPRRTLPWVPLPWSRLTEIFSQMKPVKDFCKSLSRWSPWKPPVHTHSIFRVLGLGRLGSHALKIRKEARHPKLLAH